MMIIRSNVVTIIMSITITPMGNKHGGWGGGVEADGKLMNGEI